ncbi:MAG: pilus assembly protein TadG-related protein [Kineosporiaceae bacterium]
MTGEPADRGLVPSALLLLVVVVVLTFLVLVTFPLGAATDQKTRSRTAADAAALAGAHEVREEWVLLRTAPGLLVFPAVPGMSAAAGGGLAGDYAARHQAVLTGYRLAGDGTVYARVRNTDDTDRLDGQAESDATAELPILFGACRWDDPMPPMVPRSELRIDGEEVPDDVPAEDEEDYWDELVADPRPAGFVRTLGCGPWQASYLVENVPGAYRSVAYAGGETPELLVEALEPRLVE